MRISTKGKTQLVRDYCAKYKDMPNLTLARLLYDRHGQFWKSLEDCRGCVRYARGNNGRQHRQNISGGEHAGLQRPNGKAGFAWQMPESITKAWLPFVPGTERNLILSDLHVPFHDVEALNTAVAYGLKFNPDGVLINGDLGDFYSISKFEKDPTVSRLRDEIDAMRQCLGWLRGKFPKARLIFKLGNHDEWWERYLFRKAPELVGLEAIKLERVLTDDIGDGTGEIGGVEFVKDQRRIMLGALPVFHGHELGRSSIAAPVNAARGAFLRALNHILIGHSHQHSSHTEKTILDKLIVCFSTGCLCDLHPAYARTNKYAHGFATVEVHHNKQFNVDNKRIVKGEVW